MCRLQKMFSEYRIMFYVVFIKRWFSIGMAFNVCKTFQVMHSIDVNFMECDVHNFAPSVLSYICIQYCAGLPHCSAVAMESGNMTSWCCTFKDKDLNVCHSDQGNYMIYHLIEISVMGVNCTTTTGNSLD